MLSIVRGKQLGRVAYYLGILDLDLRLLRLLSKNLLGALQT